MLDWDSIDTVLLDMDGTLLDLHFDNHFWLEFVPQRYAELKGVTFEVAKADCVEQFGSVAGTLDWYCLDYWTERLGLNIPELKEEIAHLINVLPDVTEFLDALAARGKRRVLATNAHEKSLALKMRKTHLDQHLDRLLSSHQLGHAKEFDEFWPALQQVEPFDPQRTLFVDDSMSVLKSAERYGIANIVAITFPDSQQEKRQVTDFIAVDGFSELLPGLLKV